MFVFWWTLKMVRWGRGQDVKRKWIHLVIPTPIHANNTRFSTAFGTIYRITKTLPCTNSYYSGHIQLANIPNEHKDITHSNFRSINGWRKCVETKLTNSLNSLDTNLVATSTFSSTFINVVVGVSCILSHRQINMRWQF